MATPTQHHPSLPQRRKQLEAHKGLFLDRQFPDLPLVDPAIASSWQRCANAPHISQEQDCAPISDEDEYEARKAWKTSPLRTAALPALGRLTQLANDGALIASIADPQGKLLWVRASKPLLKVADRCNALPGGHWDEQSIGTNGVSLALTLQRPITVLADEHYLPIFQDWVCYSAPIIHPQSGVVQGVLSFGTGWEQHTPMGKMAVTTLAQGIAQRLSQPLPQAELEIHALGQPVVLFRGKPLRLSPRMLEILCILALNPDGLTLDACHSALYGDKRVSITTLKSELSHLRNLLDGRLSSRVYRLLGTVWADFVELWGAIRQHKLQEALRLYQGELLPQSSAPEIEEWRTCIAVTMAMMAGTSVPHR